MKRVHFLGILLLVAVLAGALLPSLFAAKPVRSSVVPLDIHLYDTVVDEHDTTAYYNNGTVFCSGSSASIATSAFNGDNVVSGPTTAYDVGAPWTTATALSSTTYTHNTDCGNNCMRAQINTNSKIITLDTRGTATPRRVSVDFSEPCGQAQGCPGPAGDPTVFGGSITTAVLLDVYLNSPFTDMDVCTSTACLEAEPAFAKLWFDDPSNPDVTWRVDWSYLRVLRISESAWYVLADQCDGTQVAGLSKLTGKRTKPKAVFNGYYLIPFFTAAVK